MKYLLFTVDMDEWYMCRWATGSKNSIWRNTEECIKDVYNSDKPNGEIYNPTYKILSVFRELNFKSTFFFTGKVASLYPELVKEISSRGHEIGSHNLYHIDYAGVTRKRLKQDLKRSKDILENIVDKEVIGYRSPNSSIHPDTVEILEETGFRYDSSVTPTRRLFGKFGRFTKACVSPYHPSYNDISLKGKSGIIEFPWPVFPYLKLPAGSGIMHRIAGSLYNKLSNNYHLRKGYSSYYFHPYEIDSFKHDFKKPLKVKIFLKGIGEDYFSKLRKFLYRHREHIINGRDLLTRIK